MCARPCGPRPLPPSPSALPILSPPNTAHITTNESMDLESHLQPQPHPRILVGVLAGVFSFVFFSFFCGGAQHKRGCNIQQACPATPQDADMDQTCLRPACSVAADWTCMRPKQENTRTVRGRASSFRSRSDICSSWMHWRSLIHGQGSDVGV